MLLNFILSPENVSFKQYTMLLTKIFKTDLFPKPRKTTVENNFAQTHI
jgi:hypothetical protein